MANSIAMSSFPTETNKLVKYYVNVPYVRAQGESRYHLLEVECVTWVFNNFFVHTNFLS